MSAKNSLSFYEQQIAPYIHRQAGAALESVIRHDRKVARAEKLRALLTGIKAS
jgi:hypothetical protein